MATTLTVEGMSCSGCEQTVVEALEGISGVEHAAADHEANSVTVEGTADIDALVAAVDEAGYTASA